MPENKVVDEWYKAYYAHRGADRNDLRQNRGVLFQLLAAESSVVRAMWKIHHDPMSAKVLDVGCGSGQSTLQLLKLKYRPKNIVGIDISESRLKEARELSSAILFIHGDATRMGFPDDSFDLVFESTLFVTLTDDSVRRDIAAEMVRVCRPGGYIVLVDWWRNRLRANEYKALNRSELRTLFLANGQVVHLGFFRGALVPPVGRFLSAHARWAYFAVAALFPILVGQVTYLLQKR